MFEAANYTLLLDRDKLILTPKAEASLAPAIINQADELVSFGHYSLKITGANKPDTFPQNANSALTDAELLIFPLTLRNWQQGDYFMPLGMRTRKKVSDFFINQKVPLHQKTNVPLLVNGNGDIIWIAGYRMDNRYKLTPQTKKVTIFELLKP
jgi:tRNA(Ile)-lysidine synthase